MEIYQAHDLKSLESAVRREVAGALGGSDRLELLTMILGLENGSVRAMVCNLRSLTMKRHFWVVGIESGLIRLLDQPDAIEKITLDWGDLFDVETMASIEPESGDAVAYLAHARGTGQDRVGLIIHLARKDSELAGAVREKIVEVAQCVLHAAKAVVQSELLRREVQEMAIVHEKMVRTLVAPDKSTLLSDIAELLGRHFGFTRIFIALLDAHSKTYRSELHTGFETSFASFSIPADRRSHFVVRMIETGTIVVFDREGTEAPDLKALSGENHVRRALLAPLKIGSRPLGFIYADRPRHEGAFATPGVFEIFIRLASAAMESLVQRVGAEQRAETDPLTGIFNRSYLDRVLEVEIPRVRRYNSPISMLMIDLCDFKRTNDTYGHVFGDHILRETASLIGQNVREPDIVVRYGGDEFVVLMVNTNEEQARTVQDRIEGAFIERNGTQQDESMMIDISVGLRCADADSIQTLLEDADRSMYHNKTERKKRQLVEVLLGIATTARHDVIDSVINSLLSNLNNKEPFYQSHSRRVAFLCLAITRELALTASELRSLLLAALLHDVGKASLPAEILTRPGPLTDSEYQAVREHAIMGEEFFQNLPHLESARPLIRHHHERYDGNTTGEFPGYPYGLVGDDIPLGARILKLADSVDAMLSDRPYRKGRPIEEVIEVIRKESGLSFDPRLTKVLLHSEHWRGGLDSSSTLALLYEDVSKEAEEAVVAVQPAQTVG